MSTSAAYFYFAMCLIAYVAYSSAVIQTPGPVVITGGHNIPGGPTIAPVSSGCGYGGRQTTTLPPGCTNGCKGRHEKCGAGNGILGCDDRCESYQMRYVESQICQFFEIPMCVCEDGYARDDNAVCVRLENCPCKCNEERAICGNKCGQTCDTYYDVCTEDCESPQLGQCSCKKGYVRCTAVSFDCVPVAICKALTPSTTT